MSRCLDCVSLRTTCELCALRADRDRLAAEVKAREAERDVVQRLVAWCQQCKVLGEMTDASFLRYRCPQCAKDWECLPHATAEEYAQLTAEVIAWKQEAEINDGHAKRHAEEANRFRRGSERADRLEAEAAAMREALTNLLHRLELSTDNDITDLDRPIREAWVAGNAALSPDAGRHTLARIEAGRKLAEAILHPCDLQRHRPGCSCRVDAAIAAYERAEKDLHA